MYQLMKATNCSPGQAAALTDLAYAPYVTLESQPRPWMKFIGDVRANILHYDVHNVCRITCSLEPNGAGNNIVPALKGNVIVGPWVNTDFFLNAATGFHSFDERETHRQYDRRTVFPSDNVRGRNTNPAKRGA